LIQLVKGLIEKVLTEKDQRAKPKFFNDKFLEEAYQNNHNPPQQVMTPKAL
jgi:hypothetical protein